MSVLVLDGGLSTELERRGHDLSGRLWSARLLVDDPEAVVEVHADFLRAGARVITTASYQATAEGFARAGHPPDQFDLVLRRSVQLARQAQQVTGAELGTTQRTWVAGSVGPYGAMLADGSEYTGDYPGVDEAQLRAFHRPRLEILADAGVDVLAVETVPSLREAAALTAELERLGHPGWLSLTTVVDRHGRVRTRDGEPAERAYALAAGAPSIVAVGVNCTGPDGLEAAISVAAAASGKPVFAYPNSGEGWDAGARAWVGTPDGGAADGGAGGGAAGGAASGSDGGAEVGRLSGSFDEAQVQRWIDAGARGIGGCCRVGPETIARLSERFAALSAGGSARRSARLLAPFD